MTRGFRCRGTTPPNTPLIPWRKFGPKSVNVRNRDETDGRILAYHMFLFGGTVEESREMEGPL